MSRDYPDVTLEHILVDAAAMFLVTRPASFDVILTENMFGDILTDEASVLTGSMGNPAIRLVGRPAQPAWAAAWVVRADPRLSSGYRRAKASPTRSARILSAAMLLRHSLGLEAEARAIESAVDRAITDGCRTVDLGGKLTTQQMLDAISSRLPAGVAKGA